MIKKFFRRKKDKTHDYNSCCAAHMRSVALAIELAQQGIVINSHPYLTERLSAIARTFVQYRHLTGQSARHEKPLLVAKQ